MPRGTKAGHDREREFKRVLEAAGWFVMRSPASKGVCDLIAIRRSGFKDYARVRFYEIKSTSRGPFAGFPPADRDELIRAALAAGAVPVLAWRPPRGKWQEFTADQWPALKEAA